MSKFTFQKATKSQRKARIAMCGVSGSGKTYSALAVADGLGDRVAVIDTENGSASLYSDRFSFDVLELATFEPENFVEAIRAAEDAGYDVIVVDSLSHAWIGKGGALEQVEQKRVASQSKNSFDAWRHVTPKHNALVEALVRCRSHLIVTMRSKAEYVIETNERGKQAPRKVGMAPVQRDGLEYEMDVVGDIDLEHNWIISKTRCPALADRVFNKPGAEVAETLRAWLSDGAPVADVLAEIRAALDAATSVSDIDAARARAVAAVKAGKITQDRLSDLAGPAAAAKERLAAAAAE
jgi:hypothetical protein